ncbi:MAG TPA: group I intron-associated PD-(D/E)XK endonuclease [Ktedonobacteraceae bacterium]|nr:group I intron-associated PD-(D/E)XK endonuclease [Ktedonobacteraceae bacterium]
MEPMKPKQNHKAIGELSEVILIAKLLEVGYEILTPFGDNRRYDLVIEDADGRFWRIQCKTGRSNGEYIQFTPASLYYHTHAGRTTHGSKNYKDQIDYFAVYCPENREVYLIPVAHAGVSQMNLRLVPTKNKQEQGVKWAEDYEL